MIRIAPFTPSDDVLQAIRSLRAEDDGADVMESEAAEAKPTSVVETPALGSRAVTARYDHPIVGRYLRARA